MKYVITDKQGSKPRSPKTSTNLLDEKDIGRISDDPLIKSASRSAFRISDSVCGRLVFHQKHGFKSEFRNTHFGYIMGSDDLWTKVNIKFYIDAADAVFKALEDYLVTKIKSEQSWPTEHNSKSGGTAE